MRKFSKEQIDGARSHFQTQGHEEVQVTLGTRTFSYFVIPQSNEPNLQNFVLRLTGELEDGYVLGISNEVPEEFRQYAVAHEYIEFMELGRDMKDSCVTSRDRELQLVPENIKPDYVRMRLDFFRNLIPYCSAQPQNYSPDDLMQFQRNVDTLEQHL